MILFLDFDGVLSSHLRHEPDFCRLPLLWEILRAAPEAKVVFSTSWREVHRPEELLDFSTYGGGEDLAHRFVGQTPRIKVKSDHDPRDLEIQRWLDTNKHTGHWLALDDMPELFHGGHPNLYLVNGDTGLTEADVAAIIQRIQPSVSEAEWNQQTIDHMDRMAVGEEYRKSVAKFICPNGDFD